MTRRLSLWLLLSLGVHAGLVGLALLLIGLTSRPLPMLFVDLVQGFLGGGGPVPGASGGPAPGELGRDPRAPTPSRRPAVSARRAAAVEPTTADRALRWLPAEPEATPVPQRAPAPERTLPIDLAPSTSPPREPALPEPSPTAAAVQSAPVPSARTNAEAAATPSGAAHGATPASSGGITGGRGTAGAAAGGGRATVGDGPGLGLGAREGSVLALAIPGDGGTGPGSEYQGYARLLRLRVQEALAYPPAALRRQLTGSVELRVTVDAAGAITEVALAASSSHRLLDEAAVQAAREVGRVPFPPDIAPRPLRVPVPVRFDLR